MKQIFTLLFLAFATQVSAQFTENFEGSITSLTSNCWTAEQVNYSSASQDVITGSASAYTNPPTSGTGERTLSTPFLDMLSTTVTISFKYKVSSKINGQATRTIRVGIMDKNDVFTQLDLITMNSSNATTVYTYNRTFTIATPGVYRLGLRLGGATGDGNSRLIFDDIYVSASAHYGPTVHCNTGAVTVNDTYSIPVPSPYSGSLFTNDNIPVDGDTYGAVLVADSTHGTLVVRADGTFTFTPLASFMGGSVTFTYQVNDYGYTPLVSNIATVTLNFGYVTLLPMQLKNFAANSVNGKAILNWSVTENEAGKYFEIQRSADGQNFQKAGIITATNKTGVQEYVFTETFSGKNTYYRIRLVNASHVEMLSQVRMIKSSQVQNQLTLLGNPVQTKVQFSVTGATSSSAVVSVYNMAGIRVSSAKIGLVAGANQHAIDMSTQPSGNYIIEIADNGAKTISRFVKELRLMVEREESPQGLFFMYLL
jgi:hypothetical protein